MPIAPCADNKCNCVVEGDSKSIIKVTGVGTKADPIIIGNEALDKLLMGSTGEINITLSQLPDAKVQIKATPNMPLGSLNNVGGGVLENDGIIKYNLSTKQWVYSTVGRVATSVTVDSNTGLSGTGSIGNPLKIGISGSGTEAKNLELYYDTTANELRAKYPTGLSVTWNNITDKPSVFPTNVENVEGLSTRGQCYSSTLVDNKKIYVQSTKPTGNIPNGSLWFW